MPPRESCILNYIKHFPLPQFNAFPYCYFVHGMTAPSEPGPVHCRDFTISLRHTTFGRIPLEEWSAARIELYLTTQSTHNGHPCQPPSHPAGFEKATPACEKLQSYALDRAATFLRNILFFFLSGNGGATISVWSSTFLMLDSDFSQSSIHAN